MEGRDQSCAYQRDSEPFRAFARLDLGRTLPNQLSSLSFPSSPLPPANLYPPSRSLYSLSYNASALVNKANCVFQRGDVGAAKDLYLEALGVEAGCLEGESRGECFTSKTLCLVARGVVL